MKDVVVFAERDTYAGWPANHGGWQWGNEILVGFLSGAYQPQHMHSIKWPFAKRLARSMDGGETWQADEREFEFKPLVAKGRTNLSDGPVLDFRNPDLALRFCGVYDHGGDSTRRGGFYVSHDRGRSWAGAYFIPGPWDNDPKVECTTRTAYLKNRELVFLSYGSTDSWGCDRTYCAEYNGGKFTILSNVDEGNARAVMPAVADTGEEIFVALRRRVNKRRWIELFVSPNGGESWHSLGDVAETGGNNGNPPALVALRDGSVVCAWGDRTEGKIFAQGVAGSVKGEKVVLRDGYQDGTGDHYDIGYPRLFQRSDGNIVCVYYWATAERPHQHIAATIVSPDEL